MAAAPTTVDRRGDTQTDSREGPSQPARYLTVNTHTHTHGLTQTQTHSHKHSWRVDPETDSLKGLSQPARYLLNTQTHTDTHTQTHTASCRGDAQTEKAVREVASLPGTKRPTYLSTIHTHTHTHTHLNKHKRLTHALVAMVYGRGDSK